MGRKEKKIMASKLCIWKNPIEGRDFLDYNEDGIFVPAITGTQRRCYDMKDLFRRLTGQKVFTRKDLLKLPNYSDVQNKE